MRVALLLVKHDALGSMEESWRLTEAYTCDPRPSCPRKMDSPLAIRISALQALHATESTL